MADSFDRFLSSSLAPEERLPDRRFVATVHARILVEERLARERRAVAAGFGKQLLALLAVAASAWIIGTAAPVADFFARSPAAGIAILLLAFGLVVAMFSRLARPTLGTSIIS